MTTQVSAAQVTAQADTAGLTALLADLALTSKVRLYLGSFAPSYASLEADFVANEATFVGYVAATTTTWSAVVVDSNGNPTTIAASATFVCTASTTSNSIGGAWLEDPTSNTIRWFPFPTPVVVSVSGQFVSVNVFLQASQLGYAEVVN